MILGQTLSKNWLNCSFRWSAVCMTCIPKYSLNTERWMDIRNDLQRLYIEIMKASGFYDHKSYVCTEEYVVLAGMFNPASITRFAVWTIKKGVTDDRP